MSLLELIQERGRVTVAAFMDLALSHPHFGYYAGAARRSGRAGDFFTSVDTGPLFGALLARQIAEMAGILQEAAGARDAPFELVEAGAGNGRLSADILEALAGAAPDVSARTRLHLVETSAAARAAQRETLGRHAAKLVTAGDQLPNRFEGVLLANELLDAMPVHQVVMRRGHLREVFVEADGRGGLRAVEAEPSTPALAAYFATVNVRLEDDWRAEVNLAAVEWMRAAARHLARGFIVLIDYGHEARELYSVTHSAGTLTTYQGHRAGDDDWLKRPGEQDITAHVDFTTLRATAESEGLQTLGLLDQSYFLMGILSQGSVNLVNLKDRLALKTLIMPGGLGSTMKVLILGKNVGRPPLAGLSDRVRLT